MQLSTKDIFPTIVAGISVYISYLALSGKTFPLAFSHRWIVFSLFLLGIIACATGGSKAASNFQLPLTIVLSVVGGLAILLAIFGLIRPSTGVITCLALTIVAMWVVTTARHIWS